MSKPDKINIEGALAHKQDLGIVTLTQKDLMLYALGIGFSTDPLKVEDYRYTYEFDENFTSFPTIASCLKQHDSMMKFMENPYFPEIEIHTVLHGEEKLYMVHKRIEVGAKYRVRNEVVDVVDRGEKKGTFIINRMNSYLVNQKGEEDLAYYIDRVTFCRSIGGTGFKGTGKSKTIPNLPKRAPDHVFKDKTFANQAMLYRLNSDPNPLHVDANVAALARFERPIIHGLATSGTVCRNLVQNLLNYDAEQLQSYEVRFTSHVYPGESLEISVWREGQKLQFEVTCVERKTKVLMGVLTVRPSAKL